MYPSIISNAFSWEICNFKSVVPSISGIPFKSNSFLSNFGAYPPKFLGTILDQFNVKNSISFSNHLIVFLISLYASSEEQLLLNSIFSGVINKCLVDWCFSICGLVCSGGSPATKAVNGLNLPLSISNRSPNLNKTATKRGWV